MRINARYKSRHGVGWVVCLVVCWLAGVGVVVLVVGAVGLVCVFGVGPSLSVRRECERSHESVQTWCE